MTLIFLFLIILPHHHNFSFIEVLLALNILSLHHNFSFIEVLLALNILPHHHNFSFIEVLLALNILPHHHPSWITEVLILLSLNNHKHCLIKQRNGMVFYIVLPPILCIHCLQFFNLFLVTKIVFKKTMSLFKRFDFLFIYYSKCVRKFHFTQDNK